MAGIGVIGPNIWVFILLTLVLLGGAAWMAGQALAQTWRPMWQALPYAALLGVGDRFLTYALFHGQLLDLVGYVSHSLILWVIALISYRLTQVGKMVAQYPWVYERDGLFSWKEKTIDV